MAGVVVGDLAKVLPLLDRQASLIDQLLCQNRKIDCFFGQNPRLRQPLALAQAFKRADEFMLQCHGAGRAGRNNIGGIPL